MLSTLEGHKRIAETVAAAATYHCEQGGKELKERPEILDRLENDMNNMIRSGNFEKDKFENLLKTWKIEIGKWIKT